jgi:hypothetical protein
MGKKFEILGDDISDGFHTFDQLYDHRCLLFVRLCQLQPQKAAWRPDRDYGTWFVLYLETDCGQISYHVPGKFLKFVEPSIPRIDEYKWDGHSSETVLKRLEHLCSEFGEKQYRETGI